MVVKNPRQNLTKKWYISKHKPLIDINCTKNKQFRFVPICPWHTAIQAHHNALPRKAKGHLRSQSMPRPSLKNSRRSPDTSHTSSKEEYNVKNRSKASNLVIWMYSLSVCSQQPVNGTSRNIPDYLRNGCIACGYCTHTQRMDMSPWFIQ